MRNHRRNHNQTRRNLDNACGDTKDGVSANRGGQVAAAVCRLLWRFGNLHDRLMCFLDTHVREIFGAIGVCDFLATIWARGK